MSSSFKYTLTKLRSLPCSLYRCAFRPEWRFVRSASSSPMVAPSASTASFLSVYGLSGVGIRILVAIELALIETGSIVFQEPHGHVARGAGHDRHNHVREIRPRMIEVELRWLRRMIRMRMVEPEELGTELRGATFGLAVVRRPHQEAPPRPFLSRVRQRHRRGHARAGAHQRAPAFVGKRFFAVPPNHPRDARVQLRPMRHSSAVQNDSLRYFSAPSGNTVTTTPLARRRATDSVAASAAPAEMPTRSPSSRASRRTSRCASSVLTLRSSSASVGS